MDKWLKFFGLWLAEGHVHKGTGPGGYTVGITNTNTEKTADLFRGIGFEPYTSGRSVRVSSIQLYKYLIQFGKAKEKFVPKRIKSLPPRRLKVLLRAYLEGDGTKSKKGFSSFSTVSKRLAEDMAEIALKCGYGVKFVRIVRTTNKGTFDGWKVYLWRRWKTPRLMNRPKPIPYRGDVWCVEVPNHTILVRRNGRVCWSGNSHLWVRWRELEGLPVSRPYAIERLGHAGYIPPPALEEGGRGRGRPGKEKGEK